MRRLAGRRRRPAPLSHFRPRPRRLRHQATHYVIAPGHVVRDVVLFRRHVQLLLLPVAAAADRRHR